MSTRKTLTGLALAMLGAVGCGAPDSGETLGEVSQSILTADLTTYETNGRVVVNFSDMSGAASDWISIATVGSPATSYVEWKYTGGGASGSLQFVQVPPGGPYEARAFYNWAGTRSHTIQQTSAQFSTTSTGTVTTDSTTYSASAPVTITFSNLPANPKTWLAIAPAGSAATSYLSWIYSGGAASGSVMLNAPASAGTYVARGFHPNSYSLVDESPTFTVGTSPTVSTPSPIARTTPIAVTFSGFQGTATDWISVAAAGSPATSYVRWTYTNGATSGSVNFANNLPAGNYEVRGFFNYAGTQSFTIRASQALTINP